MLSGFMGRCLTPRERLIVMLRFADSLDFAEIAAVLDASPAEVRETYEDIVLRANAASRPEPAGAFRFA
jgi:DNA-directed RNA polymerase specialized sigma24 family protein